MKHGTVNNSTLRTVAEASLREKAEVQGNQKKEHLKTESTCFCEMQSQTVPLAFLRFCTELIHSLCLLNPFVSVSCSQVDPDDYSLSIYEAPFMCLALWHIILTTPDIWLFPL